ncbi:NUDIX domain-containing protein [Fibrobacter sp.]|uniref:NUDIX domain-containing protein n=1 Tax=Fibrobacter sp. TaxID=35828 RepID=UPI00388F44B0
MLAVSAIVEKKGRVLLCKRPAQGAFPGWWEFPTEPLEGLDTMEDALERGVFDRLSTNVDCMEPLGAADFYDGEGGRLYGFRVNLTNNFVNLCGYDAFKWVKINDLRKKGLFRPCVMFVNMLKKYFENL